MIAQLQNNLLRCSHKTMAFLFDNGIYGLLCIQVILSQHLKTFRVDKMISPLFKTAYIMLFVINFDIDIVIWH